MPIGISRLLGWCPALPPDLPQLKPILPALRAVSCRKDAFETVGYEWDGFSNADKEVDSLKSLPLVVLSHDPTTWNTPAYMAQAQIIWDQMQIELSSLSSNGTRIVAKGSDHHIHVERPELVIQAVQDVYAAAVNQSQSSKASDRATPEAALQVQKHPEISLGDLVYH